MAQNDSAGFSPQSEGDGTLGPFENSVEWRRARIYAEGVFARFFEYKFMYDFASDDPLKDSFLSFSMPFAPVRIQGELRNVCFDDNGVRAHISEIA